MDNPTKKKLDSKRIALSQVHERAYMMKISKKFLKMLDNADGTLIEIPVTKYGIYMYNTFSISSAKRICKGCIKLLKSYEKGFPPKKRRKK